LQQWECRECLRQQPRGSATDISAVKESQCDQCIQERFRYDSGWGLDIKLSNKFAQRLSQAEYLYTHFGNGCQFAIRSDNRGQNNFRLKSGLVIGWGGAN
jgi:hypothetical protein